MSDTILRQIQTLRDDFAEELSRDPRMLTLRALDKSLAELKTIFAAAPGAPVQRSPSGQAVYDMRVIQDIAKLSARNMLPGRIADIKKGVTTAYVTVDINGMIVTSAITNAAVEGLGLAVGARVHAVIKSSNVMIAVP